MPLISPHSLRAPSADGALLSEPPLDKAGARLVENTRHLSGWDHDFQGRSARRLRDMARRQALDKARAYLTRFGLDLPDVPGGASAPLVVTGHQPELFHSGVWVKNFAVAGIARAAGGVGLNLIVDNDIPKSSSIRVPSPDDGMLRARRVEFDAWAGEIPFEDLRVQDEGLFASFADRARSNLGGLVDDPVLDAFWPLATRRRLETDRLGLRFATARRELEARWGAHNLEVPLGDVCETEAFLWFASHILARLPHFQEVHNYALARYRSAYRIRSKHHPVSALGRQDDWREAPFWAWRADEPRRRPLMVRQRTSGSMQLRIGGEAEPLMEIPLGPDREACCAVDQLRTLPARGVRLRTRALMTTMFARLLLGDLFVHGIGGAKYDELGDEVLRVFFGIEPPGFLTLSLTLWMGLGDDPASGDRLGAVDRKIRDLTYNPDRHFDGPLDPEALSWVEAKHRAIVGPVETRADRVARYHAIRRCNEALQPLVEAAQRQLERERADLLLGLRQNELARNREYAFVLHSERKLRPVMARTQHEALGR